MDFLYEDDRNEPQSQEPRTFVRAPFGFSALSPDQKMQDRWLSLLKRLSLNPYRNTWNVDFCLLELDWQRNQLDSPALGP